MKNVPHPIPYQGSKRKLAPQIHGYIPKDIDVFYEPFAGSAAMSIYIASGQGAKHFVIADKFEGLIQLWELIVNKPSEATARYGEVWGGFSEENPNYFNEIRTLYNLEKDPIHLLYLICRCVKNAVRFNASGDFTQSADKRRKGTNPVKMGNSIKLVSQLLKNKVTFKHGDWLETTTEATQNDFIYMDPPYLGTSVGSDKRYHQQLLQQPLIDGLEKLNNRNIRFLLSYDGMTGEKEYGPPLPETLSMKRLLLNAGRSTQSTLQGKNEETFESLYISKSLVTTLAKSSDMDYKQQILELA